MKSYREFLSESSQWVIKAHYTKGPFGSSQKHIESYNYEHKPLGANQTRPYGETLEKHVITHPKHKELKSDGWHLEKIESSEA